ncbi:HTH-type transcriptional regulator CynR [Pigmentiphaga humi]|uniref:HTH-type transcriptional regulator CynR n=1 Tax=Pigmentiphaga humi TaxID=2478468 RepID=A0A3P4AXE7_9BURK|nr:LysR family transcriptional regulator [Pigmentiphaga humi]VCU68070.1 HTH-type transcriptional regulator CynR [Pigmentiphaga humi]
MHSDEQECFYQVALCRGLRKASERLDLAPSVVRRHIGRLEAELQIKLFDRNSRSMTLTPAGEIYLNYVEGLREGKRLVLEELDALKGLRTGHVRLRSIEGYAAELAAATIGEFRQQYPGITFELAMDGSDEILAAIETGQADIGIALSPRASHGVECAARIAAPLCAVVWPGHPLAGRASVALAELLDYPMALPATDTGVRHLIDAVARIEKLHLAPVLVTSSIAAMQTFVCGHGGVAILLSVSLRQHQAAGQLVGIPLSDPLLGRTTIDVCVLGRRRLAPAVNAYLRHLRAHLDGRAR